MDCGFKIFHQKLYTNKTADKNLRIINTYFVIFVMQEVLIYMHCLYFHEQSVK